MAEKNIDTSESFDFGIVDTAAVGNMKAVDAFLSDKTLPETDEGLEEIDEEEEALKKLQEKKKARAIAAKKQADDSKKTTEEIVFADTVDSDEEETKEDEKKEEEKPETKDDTVEQKPPEENDYETLARDLVKLGVFSQESDDEPLPKTGTDLLTKFNKEKEAGAIQWIDSFLARHGEDRRDLFDAIYINGVDPKEYLQVYSQVQSLETLDITRESNQEMIFREFYKRINFPLDKIETKLQKAKDNGDLDEEARDFHQQIIAQDKETLKEQEAASAQRIAVEEKADSDYRTAVGRVLTEKMKAKEFKGIPVSQELASKAFDFLYTKRYKTANGQTLTEFDKFILETKRPENIEQRVLLAFLKLNDFDFSKIAKRAISKESNELFTTLAQKKAKKTEMQTKTTSASTKNWLDL